MEGYKRHATEQLKQIALEDFEKLEQKDQIVHIKQSLINVAKHIYPPKKEKIKFPFTGLTQEIRKNQKAKNELYKKYTTGGFLVR